MKSKFLTLNIKDLIKGAILAFIVAVLTSALHLLESGNIEWTWVYWQPTIIAGVIALIGYLLKNLITNSQDEMAKREP